MNLRFKSKINEKAKVYKVILYTLMSCQLTIVKSTGSSKPNVAVLVVGIVEQGIKLYKNV